MTIPNKTLLNVSLMCLDLMHAADQVAILNSRANGLHLDVMDGHFAPNLALGPQFAEACRSYSALPIEAHLMTNNPGAWIEPCAQAGVDTITVHAEVIALNAFRTFGAIREMGCTVGVALAPATPLETIEHYLDQIDLLTIMAVDVGFAGQPFIPAMVKKVGQAAEQKAGFGYGYTIQVDGACNAATFGPLSQAGAESFVLGSSGLFALDDDLATGWAKMTRHFAAATGVAP